MTTEPTPTAATAAIARSAAGRRVRVRARATLGALLGLASLMVGRPEAVRAAPAESVQAAPRLRAALPPAEVDCTPDPAEPPLPAWQALGGNAWWLAGAAGDASAANRGAISNLLAVLERSDPPDAPAGDRLWLIGSGPSPVYGRALARSLRCLLGQAPTDVVAPWSRHELVLGQAGLGSVRSWAHTDVIAAMADRCPRCIERLRLRLGEQAADLAAATVDLPAHALAGARGTLGPLRWWRVPRGDTVLTLWAHPASGVITGHGLLWTDGAPDLRDTDIGAMLSALEVVEAIGTLRFDPAVDPAPGAHPASPAKADPHAGPQAWRWLPEQGALNPLPIEAGVAGNPTGAAANAPLTGPIAHATSLPARHRVYWHALQQAVEQAQAAGTIETELPATLPGVDPAWLASPRHALNWQRAWRQAEADWAAGAAVPARASVR